MPEPLIEDNSLEYEEFNVCENVANLSSALSSLTDIDSGLLSEIRKQKLSHMKRMIFDSLYFFCECLPQPIDTGGDGQC